MPVGKASWRQFTGGVWVAGPRENVPSGNLRRATGTYPMRSQGSILSCSGNTLREASNGDGPVRTITQFQGNAIVARRTGLTSNGVAIPTAFVSGGGTPAFNGKRVEFLELPSQFLSTSPNVSADLAGISPNTDFLFVSGAGPAYKLDASQNGTYWGIDAPSSGGFMSSVSVVPNAYGANTSKLISSFPNPLINMAGAGPSGFGFAVDTHRFVNGPNDSTSSSVRMDCPRDGETIVTQSFAPSVYSPLDLTQFTTPGQLSTDEDYIQFWVHIVRPVNVNSINIKFFVQSAGIFNQNLYIQDPNIGSTNTAIYTDYYHTELTIQVVKEKRKRQLLALGDFVPFDPDNRAMKKYLAQHPPDKGPDLDAMQFLNPRTVAVSRNTWTRVTIPKGLFDRAGKAGQSGFTWANIVGMQLSVECNKNGNTSVWWDDVELMGGVGTRGDYLYTFTFRNDNTGARSNPPYTKDSNGVVTLTTTSPITLDRQSSTITLPASLIASSFRGGASDPAGLGAAGVLDNQVTHIEVWRTIGNGAVGKPGTGESNALFNAPQSIQMFLVDKVAVGTTSFVDATADYPGMHSLSSAKFLNSDQELLFDNQPPWTVNSSIGTPRATTMGQAVYHPPTGRVFYLDSSAPTRVFVSPPGRPESVTTFIEPTTKDDPLQRLVVWNDTLYMLSQRRIFVLVTTDLPFAANPLAGVPGTQMPYTVTPIPGGFFYVAPDGARLCDGQTSNLVAQDSLGPVFRHGTLEGLLPYAPTTIDTTMPGNFAAYCRDEVFLTSSATLVFVWSPAIDAWRVLPLANVTAFFEATAPLATNPGVILAGVNSNSALVGDVFYFDGTSSGEQGGIAGDSTTFGMNAADVGSLDVQTPSVFVSGENQGIVMLCYIEADTQAQNIGVTLLLETSSIALGNLLVSGVPLAGKRRYEFNINQPANVAALEFTAPLITLTKRIEISSIEIQVYESAGE